MPKPAFSPINAGQYKQRFVIQQLIDIQQDPTGDIDQTQSDLYTTIFPVVWGNVHPMTGRERWAAERWNAEMTALAWCRYFEGITPGQQLLWRDKTFKILAVFDIEGAQREIEMQLQEMPADQPIRNPT
jgi:SPP1 family predicted phage head-tail adaptor